LIRAEYNADEAVGSERSILGSDEKHITLPGGYSGPDALNKLLPDSIDDVLIDLLGARAREAIYDNMERNRSTARSDIPDHLDEFFRLFERNFGAASKKVIGTVIAKKVYSKLGWEFYRIPTFEFNDYLQKIKTRLTEEVSHRAKSATGQFP
jgi:hypothetical protein